MGRLRPELSYVALGLYALVSPLLVRRTLRFRAHCSAYRGVRFRFAGTLAEGYRSLLFWPLLVPLTLGLAYPLVAFKQRRFYAASMAFGGTLNRSTGTSGPFYGIYGSAFGVGVLGALAVSGLAFLIPNTALAARSVGTYNVSVVGTLAVLYVGVFASGMLLRGFINARVTNYTGAQHPRRGPL